MQMWCWLFFFPSRWCRRCSNNFYGKGGRQVGISGVTLWRRYCRAALWDSPELSSSGPTPVLSSFGWQIATLKGYVGRMLGSKDNGTLVSWEVRARVAQTAAVKLTRSQNGLREIQAKAIGTAFNPVPGSVVMAMHAVKPGPKQLVEQSPRSSFNPVPGSVIGSGGYARGQTQVKTSGESVKEYCQNIWLEAWTMTCWPGILWKWKEATSTLSQDLLWWACMRLSYCENTW